MCRLSGVALKKVERVEGLEVFYISRGGEVELETSEKYDSGRTRRRIYRIKGDSIFIVFDAMCVNDLIERVIYESY